MIIVCLLKRDNAQLIKKGNKMNVSNVAIIKSESPYAAIQEAIKGFFNEDAAANYLDSIVFEDGVATSFESNTCEITGNVIHATTYFIPTVINSILIRVEQCRNVEIFKASNQHG